MPNHDCHRKDCRRVCSEFGTFLNRRHLPRFEGHAFCSENCLRAHVKDEFVQRWHGMQQERNRRIPRPKLGTILMQTASLTREQLEEAIRLQKLTREGRLGEWLLRLGFVDERQITVALAKQCGLPMIDLKNSEAKSDAVSMIPAQVAKCSSLVPVSYDDGQDSLRVAVSGPVNFNLQQALRRMIGKGISTFIGDDSVIQSLLASWYEPEALDLSKAPVFSSLDEFVEILRDTVSAAVNQKATNLQAELLEKYFWARLDTGSRTRHYFYRYISIPTQSEAAQPVGDPEYAVASGGIW